MQCSNERVLSFEAMVHFLDPPEPHGHLNPMSAVSIRGKTLIEAGWMGDSMVTLMALDCEVDILVASVNTKLLTLHKSNGKEIILGRLPHKNGKGFHGATTALQRSVVQGNVWNRISLAVAVGGRM